MTIPDLLRRAALAIESEAMERRAYGSQDMKDALALRVLADRLEKPTEEMADALMHVFHQASDHHATEYSWPPDAIIAAIAAAGEGL